jgi:hypothetical protein
MVIKSVGFGGDQKNGVAFITPPDLIVKSIELKILSKEEHVDKSTVIRQFLYMGARD